jgi:eukaryotic-like serine/threonine-protein kinase
MAQPAHRNAHRIVGRYAIFESIAEGGMATVHVGRMVGAVGFARTIAVKQLHPRYAKDKGFVSMFLDEARLAARIRHPNVVPTLDVVTENGELFLIMEYVHGESLSHLIRQTAERGWLVPPPIALNVMIGALHGLHAAHEASDERGRPLGIVHRDVSPQNIIVGVDGVSRVLDFGVAKACWRAGSTRDGEFKGKIQYSPPEQLVADPPPLDRRVDVYAAAVCLWEALTGRKLFPGESPGAQVQQVMKMQVRPPSEIVPGLPSVIDHVVMSGLARDPKSRFSTARDMAVTLESAIAREGMGFIVTQREVGEWVDRTVKETLQVRARRVAAVEAVSLISGLPDGVRIASFPPPGASVPAGYEPSPLTLRMAPVPAIPDRTLAMPLVKPSSRPPPPMEPEPAPEPAKLVKPAKPGKPAKKSKAVRVLIKVAAAIVLVPLLLILAIAMIMRPTGPVPVHAAPKPSAQGSFAGGTP